MTSRNPNAVPSSGGGLGSIGGTPITTGFATVVIAALILLFVARKLFGSVTVGTR